MLIATVTFAAGFTLPGGLNQDKGSPILKSNAAFIAFVITDSLSFVLSTSSILLLFYSSLGRKERKLGKKLHGPMVGLCLRLTYLAMIYMVIAFGTGLFAVLGVSRGFGIFTLLIVLSFFIIIYVLPIGAFVEAASRQGVVTEMPSVLDYATSSPLWSFMRNMRAVYRAIHITVPNYKMASNRYGHAILDVAVADGPPNLVSKNKLIKLQDTGVRLGGQVLDENHQREETRKKT
ncbi:hypothetical protein K1719_011092 [Acacia pycnantha]|nr:hypothetical protein K1719_011092 [Acacia pycnantha]